MVSTCRVVPPPYSELAEERDGIETVDQISNGSDCVARADWEERRWNVRSESSGLD